MIGTSGHFESINCPDPKCQRPYCHYNHSRDIKNVINPTITAASTSTKNVFSPKGSEESKSFPVNNIYEPTSFNTYGYIGPSTTAGQLNVNITQDEPSSSYIGGYTGYYSVSNQYNPDNFTSYYSQAVNDYAAYAPVAPSYDTNIGYDVQPEVQIIEDVKVKIEPTNEVREPIPKKKRRLSEDAFDPNKPRIPPELSSDPLLKSLEKKKKKEDTSVVPSATSKKAKRPVQKASAVTVNNDKSVRTEEVNINVQRIAEIDKKIAELRKADERKNISDIDALFDDDDDEPAPAPIKRNTSSTSSKNLASNPSTSRKSTDMTSGSDSDIIIIDPPSSMTTTKETTQPVAKSNDVPPAKVPTSVQSAGSSKRVAHTPSFPVNPKGPALKTPLQRKIGLQEQLQRRKEIAAEEASKKQTTIPNSVGKVRVAHTMKNMSVTSKKTDPRMPPSRPEPKDLTARKIPLITRRKMLQKLIEELLKFKDYESAVEMAINDEYELMGKTAKATSYVAGANGLLRKYKEMNGSSLSRPGHNKVSHLDVMKGKHKESISVGVHSHYKKNAERVKEMTESELYTELYERYLLSDEELVNNGYPLWEDETSKEKVKIKIREGQSSEDVFVDDTNPFRKCCRCKKTYRQRMDDDDDFEEEDCTYHWGKLWKKKEHANWVSKYTCCNGDSGSGGCCLGKAHVTQMNLKSMLKEFVEAPPRINANDPRSTRLVALDCEMVYTSKGCEVARLSVVNYEGKMALDVLIKPEGRVIDSNYRFSGLTEEQVNAAKLDLNGARRKFFDLVNKDSILIGHSLESDLKSMRIVHKNVVDTSVLYPHKLGPPMKRALKNLSSEVLMKIIQEDVTGHDSTEDAQITLQLVLHKLMNE